LARKGTRLKTIAGTVPELADLPAGCTSPTLRDRRDRCRVARAGRGGRQRRPWQASEDGCFDALRRSEFWAHDHAGPGVTPAELPLLDVKDRRSATLPRESVFAGRAGGAQRRQRAGDGRQKPRRGWRVRIGQVDLARLVMALEQPSSGRYRSWAATCTGAG
jgi:hypothetical protein